MKPFSNKFNENWDGINRKKNNLTEQRVIVYNFVGDGYYYDISTDQGIVKALEAIFNQEVQTSAGDSWNVSNREREAARKNQELKKMLEVKAKERKLKAVYRGISNTRTIDYGKANP